VQNKHKNSASGVIFDKQIFMNISMKFPQLLQQHLKVWVVTAVFRTKSFQPSGPTQARVAPQFEMSTAMVTCRRVFGDVNLKIFDILVMV